MAVPADGEIRAERDLRGALRTAHRDLPFAAARRDFLPLNEKNWITCGNALRLDWLSICRPTGTGVKHHADDLFHTPLDQAQIDFENEGGETFICGNPPYLGSKWQSSEQKADLGAVFEGRAKNWKSLDYVAAWLMKAAGGRRFRAMKRRSKH